MRFQRTLKQLSRLVSALFLIATLSEINFVSVVQAQAQVNLRRFDMLTADSGWILLDEHLFWTLDAGASWNEIGPSMPPDAVIQNIKFIDPDDGWLLYTTSNSDGTANFQLAHTTDYGKTWATSSLSLFEPGEIASNVEKAEMNWFNSQTGWISVKQNSGSNFSIGTLFTTSDGGNSWNHFPLPVADNVYFSDPQNGWAVGGPGGDQIFSTLDAGATWKKITPDNVPDDAQVKIYPPFILAGRGLLVTTALGTENSLNVYALQNPDQWSSVRQVDLDVQPGLIGLSILDAQNFLATIPGTSIIVRMANGKLNTLKNEDDLSASIVDLDMISLDSGWAKSIESNCVTASRSDRESASVSCASTARLLRTSNGGVTWQVIRLPDVPPNVSSNTFSSGDSMTTSTIAASGNTALFTGQGFDRCEIPTLSQMQTWSESSPYKTVNLYIGGSSRACDNNALISSYLFLLNQQGWKFFPTWVGSQAPCTGFGSRMSSDVNTAYTQGVNEANSAVDRLAQLGLTGPDKTGSVIYYDIENYGTNTACRSAVNAFMNGWVSQLHARGNVAGVYASTLCDTGLNDFQKITNVPDVIWPARWYHDLGKGDYDPTATVWNLGSCVPNTAWADHQRIRQYEGDHNETWGNLTLDIDSDVLDGVVAFPYDYPFVSSITRSDPDPTNAAVVNFTIKFSKSVTGVNKADFKLITTGVAGAAISTLSGADTTYTMSVNTGTDNGTIGLDLVDNDSIKDATGNSLGGTGAGNGNYTSGEIYTVHKTIDADTVGVFRPSNGLLYLKNTNATGFADIAINYGLAGDYPVVGDWDGDGTVTIGIYRDGKFYLRNSNTIGFADMVFAFGQPGDQPIAGDWDGDGTDTIGIYRPSTGQFLLRNSNSAGDADASFYLGNVGDVGIAGDWDGDGKDTTGVFRPINGIIFLKNTNETGFADVALNYGIPGDKPVTGDWNNDGIDTIGVYRNGQFMLRDSNTVGFADYVFGLGNPGDMPIAGNWDGLP